MKPGDLGGAGDVGDGENGGKLKLPFPVPRPFPYPFPIPIPLPFQPAFITPLSLPLSAVLIIGDCGWPIAVPGIIAPAAVVDVVVGGIVVVGVVIDGVFPTPAPAPVAVGVVAEAGEGEIGEAPDVAALFVFTLTGAED